MFKNTETGIEITFSNGNKVTISRADDHEFNALPVYRYVAVNIDRPDGSHEHWGLMDSDDLVDCVLEEARGDNSNL